MKQPIPEGTGLAICESLYGFEESKKTDSKIASRLQKRKHKLYASRYADDKIPFIQVRGER